MSPTISLHEDGAIEAETSRTLGLHRRNLLNSALVLTSLSTQLITLLVANMSQDKAVWNDAEIGAVVDFFWENRAKGGDGGNFKDVTINAAVGIIAPHWTSGPVKTAKQIKTKWGSVSRISSVIRSGVGTDITFAAQDNLSSDRNIQGHHIRDTLG